MALVVLVLAVLLASGCRILVLQARVRALERHAMTDPLTGVFNRRYMHDALVRAVERRRRSGDHASLLLIDIDRFKALNDTSGHGEGDRVLRGIAALIQQRIRRIDALFRLGGDEFGILLSGARLPEAGAVAEQLRRAVAGAGDGRLSISVGVAELESRESAADWLAAADTALYEAKDAGRDRVAARPVRPRDTRRRVS